MIPLALALLIVTHFQKVRFSSFQEVAEVGRFLNEIRLSLLGGDGIETIQVKIEEWRFRPWYKSWWARLARQYWEGNSLVESIESFNRVHSQRMQLNEESRRLLGVLAYKFWGLFLLVLAMRIGMLSWQEALLGVREDLVFCFLAAMGSALTLIAWGMLVHRKVATDKSLWLRWESFLWQDQFTVVEDSWTRALHRLDQDELATGVSRLTEKRALIENWGLVICDGQRQQLRFLADILPVFELLGGGIVVGLCCGMPLLGQFY